MRITPHFVDWAITPKCNLSCRHCRGFPEGELSTERAKKLIAEIAELSPSWVIVEGGEPLLRQDLFELLGLMRQRQLDVYLITNGMLLTPRIITTPFLQQIKDPKTRAGYCQSCPYLEDCKGCRSRIFVLTGDWFASDPCCPLSLKLAAKEG